MKRKAYDWNIMESVFQLLNVVGCTLTDGMSSSLNFVFIFARIDWYGDPDGAISKQSTIQFFWKSKLNQVFQSWFFHQTQTTIKMKLEWELLSFQFPVLMSSVSSGIQNLYTPPPLIFPRVKNNAIQISIDFTLIFNVLLTENWHTYIQFWFISCYFFIFLNVILVEKN